MEIFLKFFLFLSLFINTQYMKVSSIIDFLSIINEAQNKNYIKITSFEFKENNLKLEGYIIFKIMDNKKDEFVNFLKEKKVNIKKLENEENTIFIYESYIAQKPYDFNANFLYSFYKLISSKIFYLLIILFSIFYLLLWGRVLL